MGTSGFQPCGVHPAGGHRRSALSGCQQLYNPVLLWAPPPFAGDSSEEEVVGRGLLEPRCKGDKSMPKTKLKEEEGTPVGLQGPHATLMWEGCAARDAQRQARCGQGGQWTELRAT